jgi:hypothetical protein
VENEEAEVQQDYNALFGLRSLPRRIDILRRAFLNNRFERRSPLPALTRRLSEVILGHEVAFPPRNLLMRPGGQSIEGLFFLGSLVKAIEAKTVVEIGTFEGVTAWFLAKNAGPGAQIHTLDIPPDRSPSLPLDQSDEHRGDPRALLYNYLPSPGAKITQHWDDSAVFDFSPWKGSCDLIYIDGAHSTDYVRSDTQNAVEMLGDNGAIVWDDYWRLSPGVTQVLHQLTELRLFRVPSTRLVVHLSPQTEQLLLTRKGTIPRQAS